jgi:hypothetical protein
LSSTFPVIAGKTVFILQMVPNAKFLAIPEGTSVMAEPSAVLL